MIKRLLFLFLFPFLTLSGQPEVQRILVQIDDKIGYLNEEGKMAIPACFAAGGNFRNGLAPVRESGLYGYINYSGDYVLPPAYEYAEPFRDGLARVWEEGVPRIIDLRGCNLFLEQFAEISLFYHHSYAVVKTEEGKYGLIDRAGRFLVDTILRFPPSFDQAGLAAVEAFDYVNRVGGFRFGVIDTTGTFVFPFTPLNSLESLGNGYYEMSYPRERKMDDDGPSGIIGPKGQLTTNFYSYKWSPDEEEVSVNGIIPARVYDVNMLTIRSWNSGDRLHHAALISADGRIIADEPQWELISSFTDGRAFVYDANHRFWLIDESGQLMSDTSFLAICGFDKWGMSDEDLFRNEEAIVRKGRYWYRMDWDLKLTRLPDFGAGVEVERSGNLLLLKVEQGRGGGDAYGKIHGWYDLTTNTLVLPQYEAYIAEVEGTDWLTTKLDGRRVFLRRNSELIWQAEKKIPESRRNIDFLERANFEAHQWRPENEYRNVYQRIDENAHYMAPWMMAAWLGEDLRIYTSIKDHLININVINLASDSLWFPAQDGVIGLIIQARDEAGEWRDIQYLGESWCGHSYHTLALPPNNAWNFKTPVYDGAFNTDVRAKLTYQVTLKSEVELTIFGNPVLASVNPAQFWRKPGYQPGGLMDPYLE